MFKLWANRAALRISTRSLYVHLAERQAANILKQALQPGEGSIRLKLLRGPLRLTRPPHHQTNAPPTRSTAAHTQPAPSQPSSREISRSGRTRGPAAGVRPSKTTAFQNRPQTHDA